jgi:hypothetical protein
MEVPGELSVLELFTCNKFYENENGHFFIDGSVEKLLLNSFTKEEKEEKSEREEGEEKKQKKDKKDIEIISFLVNLKERRLLKTSFEFEEKMKKMLNIFWSLGGFFLLYTIFNVFL